MEKALGAHRWHILFQFLAEAMVITALGGLLGVAFAYPGFQVRAVSELWGAFQEGADEGDIHLAIDAAPISGRRHSQFCRHHQRHASAIKAAKLDPIEALDMNNKLRTGISNLRTGF